MALVVFLKGVNVGGHRTFRPSALAKDLARFDVVNIGAAGTFVVRKPVTQAALRHEVARRLPFETDVMICSGADVLRLVAADPFAGQAARADVVQFVSVLAKRRPTPLDLPPQIPPAGPWGVKILAVHGRFICTLCRREMKAIGYLARLEKLFGAAVTTRSWSTVLAVAGHLTN